MKEILWYSNATGREWSSGLRLSDQNWKVPGSNPLGTRPGLGTRRYSKAPGDLWVKIVKTQ